MWSAISTPYWDQVEEMRNASILITDAIPMRYFRSVDG
ncbi:hypothetical protein PA08_1577 [Cutibacterium modestum P08]|nr:hypothetical protein PA08_1577 [Cutibacterium modestum P08]